MKLINFHTLVILISMFCLGDTWAYQYSGTVVNQMNVPVNDAIVRLQGTPISTRTNVYGKFKIEVKQKVSAKHITAWKSGFYNGGALIYPDKPPYHIVLSPIESADNKSYEWLPSSSYKMTAKTDTGDESQPCQHCHPQLVREWKKSAHSGSAANPVFITFFNGTDVDGNKNISPGFKIDFENSNGKCAACHIPTMAMKNTFDADPNAASGIDKEGITCDFCHKVKDMRIDKTGEKPGVRSYRFSRPSKGHQLFYGPYDDVFPGDDSYHTLYSKSHYCAPCHNGKFWGVLAYSEFQEWLESSYSKRNIHCQDCHMKPDGETFRFALEKVGGLVRDPKTIPSHTIFGINDKNFMEKAISLKTNADIDNNILKVTVKIRNTNAGHHYPTGNPMRNMILLVETKDEKGNPLTLSKGSRVPSWGGKGLKKNGNYAGLPGKGFAKVLRNRPRYGFKFKRTEDYKNSDPVPHWRRAIIESDNRIPANSYDLSTYKFMLPTIPNGKITVETRLIFRRGYKSWFDSKNLNIADMEIGRSLLHIK